MKILKNSTAWFKKHDLSGKRFGKLKVIKFLYFKKLYDKEGKRRAFFLCKCDCGGKKIANGNPRAMPNPVIPTVNFVATIFNSMPIKITVLTSPPNVPANKVPKIGPVQENETIAKVRAIKNTPINPPIFDPESALLPQLLGRVNS